MTNLATYTQIAQLVKSWAAQIDMIDLGYLPANQGADALDQLRTDMHAFSNGLLSAVDTFAPIVAELNKIVADDNVVEHNNLFGVERDDPLCTCGFRISKHPIAGCNWTHGEPRYDIRCPNDGEPVNVRCWKCGWVR